MKAKAGSGLFAERREGIYVFASHYEWEVIKQDRISHCVIVRKKNAQLNIYLTTLSVQIHFDGEQQISKSKTTMEYIELLFVHPRKNLNTNY